MTTPQQPTDLPRITVVIPNYDRVDLLEETIRSVCERERVMIVVADDCSPDPSVRPRLVEMRDAGLIDQLVLLRQNSGIARAINAGIEEATTPYVHIIANDDRFEPGALARLADLLDETPNAVAACGAFRSFGASERYYQPPPWDPWRLLYRSLWPASYMLRRTAWEALGGIPTDSAFEDWNAYLEYAGRGWEVAVLDGLVYHYRVRPDESLWSVVRADYASHYRTLVRRHSALFARHRQLRSASGASWTEKLLARPMTAFRLYRPRVLTELIVAVGRSRWLTFARHLLSGRR